jgi:hypothetical protein
MTIRMSHHKCIILHIAPGELVPLKPCALRFLRDVNEVTNCPLHCLTPKWIGPTELSDIMNELKKATSSSGRSVLLIAGAYLEDQVSVCALEALAEGFDVHLLCDFVKARDRRLVPVLQLRLFQAGVVPTSMQQMLYVWHAAESDDSVAAELKRLQADYEVVIAPPHPRSGLA